MPYIELLGILKLMCKIMGGQQTDRKFDSQTVKTIPSTSQKGSMCTQGTTQGGAGLTAEAANNTTTGCG